MAAKVMSGLLKAFLVGLMAEFRCVSASVATFLDTVTVESFPHHIYQTDTGMSADGFWFERMLFYGRAEGLTQGAGSVTDLVRYVDSNGLGFYVQWDANGISVTVKTATGNFTSRAWLDGSDPDSALSLSGYFQLYINFDYMQIKFNAVPGEAVPLNIDVSSCSENHDTYGVIANEDCFFGTVGSGETRSLSVGLVAGSTEDTGSLAGRLVLFSNRRTDEENVEYCWNGDEEQSLSDFPATLTACDFDFPFNISGQFQGGLGQVYLLKYEDDSKTYGLRVAITADSRIEATLTTPGKTSTSQSELVSLSHLTNEVVAFSVVATTESIQVFVDGVAGSSDTVDLSSCSTGEERPWMHCVSSFSWAENRMKFGDPFVSGEDPLPGTISGLRIRWGTHDSGYWSGNAVPLATSTTEVRDLSDYAALFLSEVEVMTFPTTIDRSHDSFSDEGFWFENFMFYGRVFNFVADAGSEIDIVRYVDSNGYGFWVRWDSGGLSATLKTTYGTYTSRSWKSGYSADTEMTLNEEFKLYIDFDYMQLFWDDVPGEAIPLSTSYVNSCGQTHSTYGQIASEDCFFGTLTNTGADRSLIIGADVGSDTESAIESYRIFVSASRTSSDEIVYCWNGEQIKSFSSFPVTVSSCDLDIPFNIKGQFKGGPGNTDLVKYQDDSQTYGLVLTLLESGRLKATFTTATKTSVSYSQQTGLIDRSGYTTFVVGVTTERIQVIAQGLSGTTDTVDLSSCSSGEDNPWLHCVLGFDWAEERLKFGYPTHSGDFFSGTISAIQTERRDEDDVINPTSLDGTIDEDNDEEEVAGSGSGDDASFLIPILITVGAVFLSLIIVVMCAWWNPHFARLLGLKWPDKQAAKPAVVAAPSSAAVVTPAAVATTGVPITTPTSVTMGRATAGPTPKVAAAEQFVPKEPPVDPRKKAILEEPIVIPKYWTNNDTKAKDLVQASSKVRLAVQDLMNETWKGVVTKDRAALGGDSRDKKVSHFEVVQVNRNENAKTYLDYAKRRRAIRAELKEEDFLDKVLTSQANFEDLGPNLDGANEFFMFHGSKPSSVTNIVSNDFMVKLAGTRRGTLYGPGLYFAESSSKADEYADDDKSGIYRGLYAMLLCRVTLGKSLYVDEAFPDGKRLQDACVGPKATHNSILGDREKARGTYREFVIFDADQVYPEYVIIYRRAERE